MIGIGIYTKNSKEAVALYCNVFGLELGYHVLNKDGNYFHSELMKDGVTFLSVAESNENNIDLSYNNPVELGYTVKSEEEFNRISSLLKEDGRILVDVCEMPWSPLATVIMDKYGVRWYITLPQHRPTDEECF